MTGGKQRDRRSRRDLDLWHEVTRQVRPLPGRRRVSTAAQETSPEAAAAEPAARKILAAGPKRETAVRGTTVELRHGTSEGLDKRQGARLRKGLLPIEGRLDLHGLHLAPAQRALDRFLGEASAQGKRCVLVITGKGRGEGGALRREVPLWLNRPAVRPMVVSFTYAQPKDGGEGALYILLRRRRPDRSAGA